MLFYRSVRPLEPIVIPNSELLLRAPNSKDFVAWAKIRRESQEFLSQWEPLWPANDLTKLGFRRRLKRYHLEREHKTGETYFVTINNKPIGGITLSNIRYGAARTCNIGYWMGHDFAGLGYMGKALPAICNHIFTNLELCRIEAACLPENERSIKLLTSAGFEREGLVKKYLEINGQRRDHVLFALLREDNSD